MLKSCHSVEVMPIYTQLQEWTNLYSYIYREREASMLNSHFVMFFRVIFKYKVDLTYA
jgi:hypothetical protein